MGSMAQPGAADDYSDIDIVWIIPPDGARGLLSALRRTLEQVGMVESLRVDPRERPGFLLVFVRFGGWPLWWRVDLEVHSAGVEGMSIEGADPWTEAESACMGVVVTLKALARQRPAQAEILFGQALRRVDGVDVDGDWRLRIDSVLDHLDARSPSSTGLVARTRQLSHDVLGR